MVASSIIFIYFVFFISMVTGLITAIKLYMHGKNYLIATLGAAMALAELNVLCSIIWIHDFQQVPKLFCIVQAIVVSQSFDFVFYAILFLFILIFFSSLA